MKSVLISIQPKWCELIASGKKTVEVRKTKPKLETPFKCYIYCTKGKSSVDFITKSEKFGYLTGHEGSFYNRAKENDANGKVIGEFVCDYMTGLKADNMVQAYYNNTKDTCLTDEEIKRYANGKKLYYWHISDLVIYDKPRELSEFYVWKKCNSCRDSGYESTACCYDIDCKVPAVISRPPQSWCYVESEDKG